MAKNTIQNTRINFKVSSELKENCEKALLQESKGLSEFLRDAMFQKAKEYENSLK